MSFIGGIFFNPHEHYGATQGIRQYITSVRPLNMNQLLELSTVGIQVLTIISCMEVETSDDCEKLRTTNDSY